jgi:hypothetical protein
MSKPDEHKHKGQFGICRAACNLEVKHMHIGEGAPWIFCKGDPDVGHHGCGYVELSRDEYEKQMNRPNTTWRCPTCGFGEVFWAGTGDYQ